MHVFLDTDRLWLRRFTPDDLENLVTLDGDPEVMRYLSGGPPTPRHELELRIPAYLDYYERYEGYGYWVAVEKSSGDFLGWFHFRPGEDAPVDEPELGYRLVRAAWGKGYGSEGSQALIDHGFTALGVRRVVASTYEHNLGSRRVMEKVGMRLVRSFHMTPEELARLGVDLPELFDGDEVEYAITRDEWEAGRGTVKA